jgi:hypothetical protein
MEPLAHLFIPPYSLAKVPVTVSKTSDGRISPILISNPSMRIGGKVFVKCRIQTEPTRPEIELSWGMAVQIMNATD